MNIKKKNPIDMLSSLKEILFSCVFALVLGSFMMGIRTVDQASGLTLDFRLQILCVMALSVIFGKIFIILKRHHKFLFFQVFSLWLSLIFMAFVLISFNHEQSFFLFLYHLFFGRMMIEFPFLFFLFIGFFIISIYMLWLSNQPVKQEKKIGFFGGKSFKDFYIRYESIIAIIGIVIVFMIPVFFHERSDRSLIDLMTLVMIYIMLGWGLNVVVGLAGLLDLGYVAFYAIGAYSYALLAIYFDLSFWICLPLAGLFAALFGIILGFPILRLRGDYLAIVTLGFGEIIRILLINLYEYTGGSEGISSIPRPSFFGLAEFKRSLPDGVPFHEMFGIEYSTMHRVVFLYYIIFFLAILTNWLTLRLRKMPIGRAWEALREDELASRSLGINPVNTKLSAFAIGAMLGGFAGAFFATRQSFISPESFTFIESAIILAIVVLGGMGSQMGIVLSAVILIALPEYFRELEEYRMLIFGMGMCMIMIWKPNGLLNFRQPTILMKKGG